MAWVLLAACAPAASPDQTDEQRTEQQPGALEAARSTEESDAKEKVEATPRPVLAAGEVMIRRTMCYGTCPAYLALVDHEGRVFYHGSAHVDRLGAHTGRVDPADVAALVDVAEKSGYFHAKHDYEDSVTAHATVLTAVVVDGRRQWVRNYAQAAPPVPIHVSVGEVLHQPAPNEHPSVEPAGPVTRCVRSVQHSVDLADLHK